MSKNNVVIDWIIRLFKGMFIGIAFIVPGLSGGAIATILGLYARLISFLANITKEFKKNFLFFLPVALGGVTGLVLLTHPLGFLLEYHFAPTMWLFIGTIIGTLPSLWKEAGKEGRSNKHILIMIVAVIVSFLLLRFIDNQVTGDITMNLIVWILVGAMFAIGFVIPGVSTSSFLIFLNVYEPTLAAIRNFELNSLFAIALGGLICLFPLTKGLNYLFKNHYTPVFHVIFGLVITSIILIIPLDVNHLGMIGIFSLITFSLGVVIGLFIGKLEQKHKK